MATGVENQLLNLRLRSTRCSRKTYEEWLQEKSELQKRRTSESGCSEALQATSADVGRFVRRKSYDVWLEEKQAEQLQVTKSLRRERRQSQVKVYEETKLKRDLNTQKYDEWLEKKHAEDMEKEERERSEARIRWEIRNRERHQSSRETSCNPC